MKVGTDGVLLGAWFTLGDGMSVLDIGAGSGLIGLLAANRGAGHVVAVEIDPKAATQAWLNVANSPWADRVEVVCADIRDYMPGIKFDRVVCNPPFFRDSLRCPDGLRTMARHNDSLSFEALVQCTHDLLASDGRFAVVLPFDAWGKFVQCASMEGLCLQRRTNVVTRYGKGPKRVLMEFGMDCRDYHEETINMIGPDGNETPEYTAIVRDFYLKY